MAAYFPFDGHPGPPVAYSARDSGQGRGQLSYGERKALEMQRRNREAVGLTWADQERIRQRAEFFERQPIEFERFVARNPFALEHFVRESVEIE